MRMLTKYRVTRSRMWEATAVLALRLVAVDEPLEDYGAMINLENWW